MGSALLGMLLLAGLGSCAVGVEESSGAPATENGSVRFGVAVHGSNLDRLETIESRVGSQMGVVRVFTRWDTEFPSEDVTQMMAEGRSIHVSVRPRTDNGQVIPWSEIANAKPGSVIHDQLTTWVEKLVALDGEVYFTLNHEPETRDSAANGSASQYVAAWRTTIDLLRSSGGEKVKTVLVLTRRPFVDGSVIDWYPGDEYVDVVGVDPYNWYHCQGTERNWTDPEDLLAPALGFARSRNKPLAIPEIASTEDPLQPGRKADWIDQLGHVLAKPDTAMAIEFVAWFNVDDQSWPDCEWAYDSSSASAEAFARLANQSGHG